MEDFDFEKYNKGGYVLLSDVGLINEVEVREDRVTPHSYSYIRSQYPMWSKFYWVFYSDGKHSLFVSEDLKMKKL